LTFVHVAVTWCGVMMDDFTTKQSLFPIVESQAIVRSPPA
jgi:hypothetical protein